MAFGGFDAHGEDGDELIALVEQRVQFRGWKEWFAADDL